MAAQELNAIARSIVADNKGVLAADESTGTIKKRFDAIGIESTEENRRAYRNLLFTTPGLEEYIGGVILYDETIRQSSDDGTPFPELLASKDVVPGIKVDTGAHDLAGIPTRRSPRAWTASVRVSRSTTCSARGSQVARSDHHRRRHSERNVPPRQRARARALRGALPGGRDRPDRGARGADGRRQYDRALPRGDARTLHRSSRSSIARASRSRECSSSRTW